MVGLEDTHYNRKLVKRVFRKQIKERGLSDFLDEMVGHWMSWEKTTLRIKRFLKDE